MIKYIYSYHNFVVLFSSPILSASMATVCASNNNNGLNVGASIFFHGIFGGLFLALFNLPLGLLRMGGVFII